MHKHSDKRCEEGTIGRRKLGASLLPSEHH
jgi:hypothetical protein